jgi:hypothetical protein
MVDHGESLRHAYQQNIAPGSLGHLTLDFFENLCGIRTRRHDLSLDNGDLLSSIFFHIDSWNFSIFTHSYNIAWDGEKCQ